MQQILVWIEVSKFFSFSFFIQLSARGSLSFKVQLSFTFLYQIHILSLTYWNKFKVTKSKPFKFNVLFLALT